jgi:4-hydroxybenzoate polyprenyltransferase
MSVKDKLLIYFQLMRFHAGISEALFFIFGALIAGQRDPFLILVVFTVGILYHIYGHVLNDYADIEVDRQSSELKNKPLVSGVVPKQHALIITVASIVLIYIFTLVYFPYVLTMLIITLAIFLGSIYNLFGKKIPGISDLVMATFYTLSFFYGVSTFLGVQYTNLIYFAGALIFVSVAFANIVEAGLKDVDHDHLSGAKTLAIVMGVKVIDGKLVATRKYKILAYGLLMLCFILLMLMLYQPEINFFNKNYFALSLVALLIIATIVGCYKILNLKSFSRSKVKKLYFLINTGTGVLFVICLYPILGPIISLILLIAPPVWYTVFSKVLYGKSTQPGI